MPTLLDCCATRSANDENVFWGLQGISQKVGRWRIQFRAFPFPLIIIPKILCNILTINFKSNIVLSADSLPLVGNSTETLRKLYGNSAQTLQKLYRNSTETLKEPNQATKYLFKLYTLHLLINSPHPPFFCTCIPLF